MKKILLVEDDADFREVACEYLTESITGIEIVAADSALKALELFENGLNPDVVITDFVMPEMNGLQLAQQLLECGYAKPIVFVTGADKPLLPHTVFKMGSFDFVKKPLDDSFIQVVQNALSVSQLKWKYGNAK